MDELEVLSNKLKAILAKYDTRWFLGNLSFLITCIDGKANDQLGKLSSPMRQLYYLGGLLMSSANNNGIKIQYSDEEWQEIIDLLNKIELEYYKNFFPKTEETITEEWKNHREIAMPSFLSYFNQGPLNYEEQSINWIIDLFSKMDDTIEKNYGIKTTDLISFYNAIDSLFQSNFNATITHNYRDNWEQYSNYPLFVADEAPQELKDLFDENRKYTLLSVVDFGMNLRFKKEDLTDESLTIEKINKILSLLSTKRKEQDFLFYTQTKPLNPLIEFPIIDLEDGLFQVFEIKQILHSIQYHLEKLCNNQCQDKFVKQKGSLLETNIIELFKQLFGEKDFRIYQSYYVVDGCEQDILLIFGKYAFIIEAKAYNIKEPFRDPEKAFLRIKNDFDSCIGYAYEQTRRVEKYFIDGKNIDIKDKNGNIIDTIDTTKIEYDFSIIVNQKSFGPIQTNLELLLHKEKDDDVLPWAVKFDDLEVFIKTLIAQKKKPTLFVDFLLIRELLHGHIICDDELQICGGFLSKKITKRVAEDESTMIYTIPDLANLFDEQYKRGMGFKNERNIEYKKSGNTLFW